MLLHTSKQKQSEKPIALLVNDKPLDDFAVQQQRSEVR